MVFFGFGEWMRNFVTQGEYLLSMLDVEDSRSEMIVNLWCELYEVPVWDV